MNLFNKHEFTKAYEFMQQLIKASEKKVYLTLNNL
jgi:hypothetical protein